MPDIKGKIFIVTIKEYDIRKLMPKDLETIVYWTMPAGAGTFKRYKLENIIKQLTFTLPWMENTLVPHGRYVEGDLKLIFRMKHKIYQSEIRNILPHCPMIISQFHKKNDYHDYLNTYIYDTSVVFSTRIISKYCMCSLGTSGIPINYAIREVMCRIHENVSFVLDNYRNHLKLISSYKPCLYDCINADIPFVFNANFTVSSYILEINNDHPFIDGIIDWTVRNVDTKFNKWIRLLIAIKIYNKNILYVTFEHDAEEMRVDHHLAEHEVIKSLKTIPGSKLISTMAGDFKFDEDTLCKWDLTMIFVTPSKEYRLALTNKCRYMFSYAEYFENPAKNNVSYAMVSNLNQFRKDRCTKRMYSGHICYFCNDMIPFFEMFRPDERNIDWEEEIYNNKIANQTDIPINNMNPIESSSINDFNIYYTDKEIEDADRRYSKYLANCSSKRNIHDQMSKPPRSVKWAKPECFAHAQETQEFIRSAVCMSTKNAMAIEIDEV